MLDYTKAAIKKTVDDFKRVDFYRNVLTQLLYILYLSYALCTNAGKQWANIPLLILSVAYFIFFMIMSHGETSKKKKQTKTIVTRIFKRCKQLIKLLTLIVMLYGIYATTQRVSPFSVILSAMMIVGWILQIVFEIILRIFVGRVQFIFEGLEADYEKLVQPAKTVGNFFKRLTGQPVEPEKARSKNKLWLDKKLAQNKAEKAAKREEKRRAKKQAKIDAKNTVFLPETPVEQPALPLETEMQLVEEYSPALALTEGEKLNKKENKRKKKSKKEDKYRS